MSDYTQHIHYDWGLGLFAAHNPINAMLGLKHAQRHYQRVFFCVSFDYDYYLHQMCDSTYQLRASYWAGQWQYVFIDPRVTHDLNVVRDICHVIYQQREYYCPHIMEHMRIVQPQTLNSSSCY